MSKLIINWDRGAAVFTEKSYPMGYGFLLNNERITRERIKRSEEMYDDIYQISCHIDEVLSRPGAEVVYHG